MLLAGCGGRPLEPEPIALDRVSCARCGMLVSRLDHAAQAVYADADTRAYDDVGCLATDAEAPRGQHRLYVHTAGGWTAVGAARFVLGSGAQTPMGYDVLAFPAAEAPERGGTRALSWAELVAALEDRP